MGEPAIPPPAERAKTRAFAAAIVDASRNDVAFTFGDKDEALFFLAQEVGLLLAERDAYSKTHEIACRLQDADQCENHSTGDDCDTGGVEHELFEHLSKVRTDDDDEDRTDPLERGEKKRGPATPSPLDHILNEVDECVSWCPCCHENTSRGLNPDGTKKES